MACGAGTGQTMSIAMCSNENNKSRIQPTLINLQLMMTLIKHDNKTMMTKVKIVIWMTTLSMLSSWKLSKLKFDSSSIKLLTSKQHIKKSFPMIINLNDHLTFSFLAILLRLPVPWQKTYHLVYCCVALQDQSLFFFCHCQSVEPCNQTLSQLCSLKSIKWMHCCY